MKVGASAHQWWLEPVGEGLDTSVRARGRGLGVGMCERGSGGMWVVAGTQGQHQDACDGVRMCGDGEMGGGMGRWHVWRAACMKGGGSACGEA